MEDITHADIDTVNHLKGKEKTSDSYNKLRVIYDKLGYLCSLLNSKGYETHLIKRPLNQGNKKLADYLWAKVYPKEYHKTCKDKLAFIIGISDSMHFHIRGIKDHEDNEPSNFASNKSWQKVAPSSYEDLVNAFITFDSNNRKLFIETAAQLKIDKFTEILENMNHSKINDLLEYKKQIILQGPPGTGKTRLAKQIANTLTASNYSKLEVNDIKHSLHIGQKIDGASGQPAYYEIEKINESNVVLSSKYTKDGGHFAKFKKVIEYYQELVQGEEVKASRSHDSYELAVAKHFYYKSNNENYKLIQFHPSYTYEDFVRGITVKSGENNLEYITENKVLAKIAKEAYNNYLDSKKESSEITKEKWLENQFDLFKDSIEDEIENNESYPLTDTIGIQQVGKRYFKYVGNGWHDYIKYSDFLLLFEKDTYDRQAIKKLLNIGSRASYYAKLAEKFNGFLDQKSKPEQSNEKVDLKNYVLIIDEINRANLSSVLGELIYALEYRGKEVSSMYDLNNSDDTEQSDTEIILPPNLYIIGTMNTADRSVSQIDYAIRRRFAFVDILPKDLSHDPNVEFDHILFNSVAEIFIKDYDPDKDYSKEPHIVNSEHLSEEFSPKDVWLGHSYFIKHYEKDEQDEDIKDKPYDFKLRLEFEIKPILREYVKDGILKKSALIEIEKLVCS